MGIDGTRDVVERTRPHEDEQQKHYKSQLPALDNKLREHLEWHPVARHWAVRTRFDLVTIAQFFGPARYNHIALVQAASDLDTVVGQFIDDNSALFYPVLAINHIDQTFTGTQPEQGRCRNIDRSVIVPGNLDINGTQLSGPQTVIGRQQEADFKRAGSFISPAVLSR